jgi:hypothetical protein
MAGTAQPPAAAASTIAFARLLVGLGMMGERYEVKKGKYCGQEMELEIILLLNKHAEPPRIPEG